jgi:hypothetical protein
VIAVIAVGLGPAIAEAGIITFRNETDVPIIVQGVGISIVNRTAWRGKLHLLRPGEIVRELNLVPGPKLIFVFDAKQPTRVLCKEMIPFTGTDLFYAIQREEPAKAKEGTAESATSKGRKAVIPRIRLVPSLPAPRAPSSSSKQHH